MTEHVYDDTGRLVRSVTTFDPDWSDEDVQAALAWQADEESRCPGCGLPRDETFDIERANAWDAEPMACNACLARDRAARAYHEKHGEQLGLYWRIFERG